MMNTPIEYFNKPIIFLVGPTASGKTELAIQIANEFGCEIIGVDSMQIYKYMDIGSAKPTLEELSRARHHLIGYVDPDESYNALRFVEDCQHAILEIRDRQKIPLLVGGTGLYFQALEHGMFDQPEINETIRQDLKKEAENHGLIQLYAELVSIDPETADRVHQNDTYRILRALEIFRSTGKTWSDYIKEHQNLKNNIANSRKLMKLGVKWKREELYGRINRRVEVMVEMGLVEEVKKLISMGYSESLGSMQSLGYRHIAAYLNGTWSWEMCLELLARDTRRYAKRQCTWFKKDAEIKWFSPVEADNLTQEVSMFLSTIHTS